MSHHIQIAVDCHAPHDLADWWAETLQWSVEPTDEEFIRRMIAEGHATEDDTMVHRGSLVWKAGTAICPSDEIGSPTRRRILFQPVPEPKQGKNRVHWDVDHGGEDIDLVRERLVGRGASYVGSHHQGPHAWHVMTDPEGNEFCIT